MQSSCMELSHMQNFFFFISIIWFVIISLSLFIKQVYFHVPMNQFEWYSFFYLFIFCYIWVHSEAFVRIWLWWQIREQRGHLRYGITGIFFFFFDTYCIWEAEFKQMHSIITWIVWLESAKLANVMGYLNCLGLVLIIQLCIN